MAEQAGVTPSLIKALASLSATRSTPMRELAVALRCDTSYVTAVVDGLEEHGLAERRPHPTDRRVKVIHLTERGAELAAQGRAALETPPPSFDALSAEDATALLVLLRKVSG